MDPSDVPGAPRGPGRERWLDAAAGPIVRPYAVTRGRTRASGEHLDIVAILVATGRQPPEPGPAVAPAAPAAGAVPASARARRPRLGPEPAARRDPGAGGDLIDSGLVDVQRWSAPPSPTSPTTPVYVQPHNDPNLLRRVLDELRAL
ncbi:DUF742 domain-containing protein [Actinomadura madurae]|uniref:DUF742 domain-containing protein n=1 Tax=Actinomadura madurae TaxID=1993 RepID=UPI003FD8A27A